MIVSMGLGTLLGVTMLAMRYFGRISTSGMVVAFAAGVLLAGSAVGHFTSNAAQTVSNTVQNARIQPAPAAPARPATRAPVKAAAKP